MRDLGQLLVGQFEFDLSLPGNFEVVPKISDLLFFLLDYSVLVPYLLSVEKYLLFAD